MFGVSVPGKLGGGAELETSADIFEDNVVSGYRDVLISTVKTLLNASGISAQVAPIGTAVEEANVDQSYTGVQISTAVDVITKVGTGELTRTGIQIGFNVVLVWNRDDIATDVHCQRFQAE